MHGRIEYHEILTNLGKAFLISSTILQMIALTEAFDNALQAMHSIRRKLLEKLLVTDKKEERRSIKYLIQRINNLRPMNACGYFEVDKSTLTSMFSIR